MRYLLSYNGQTHEFRRSHKDQTPPADMQAVLDDLERRKQLPHRTCCSAQKPAGVYLLVAGPNVGRREEIYECPSCGRIETRLTPFRVA